MSNRHPACMMAIFLGVSLCLGTAGDETPVSEAPSISVRDYQAPNVITRDQLLKFKSAF